MSSEMRGISAGGDGGEASKETTNGQSGQRGRDDDVDKSEDPRNEAKDEEEEAKTTLRVHLPTVMRLTIDGRAVFGSAVAAGGILFMEEGRVEDTSVGKSVAEKAKKALESLRQNKDDDAASGEVYNWSLFAKRESTLESSHLVPTVLFGRGALLVRRAAAEGDHVAIFCPALEGSGEVGNQEKEDRPKEASPPPPLDLSSASPSSSLSPPAATPSPILPIPTLPPTIPPQFPQFSHNPLFGALLSSHNAANMNNNAVVPRPAGRRAREKTMLPCGVCGKAFDRPSLLKRHHRTHTGEKPHICEVCNKGFSTSSSLNTHRRIHSGEKPHQCGICGKRFTASSNLYYHRMTHNKDKPHKCAVCNKSFPTPGDLKTHEVTTHASSSSNDVASSATAVSSQSLQQPFRCHLCGKAFAKQLSARNHLIAHLTGLPIPASGGEATEPTPPPPPPSAISSLLLPSPSATSASPSPFPSASPSSYLSTLCQPKLNPLAVSTTPPPSPLIFPASSSSPASFSCSLCRETFSNAAILQLHLRNHLLLMPSAAALAAASQHQQQQHAEGVNESSGQMLLQWRLQQQQQLLQQKDSSDEKLST